MTPDDRNDEEAQEIRVTDRRRFTDSGDVRPDAPEGDSDPVVASPGGPSPVTPQGTSPGASAVEFDPAPTDAPESALPPPEMEELGIAAVFLAFYQGALMSLGVPDGEGRRMPVNLAGARDNIELLRVLQEKTAGNLTQDEEAVLRRILHEVQLAYVRVAGAGGASPPGAPSGSGRPGGGA